MYRIIILFYTFGKNLSLVFDGSGGGDGRIIDPPGRRLVWGMSHPDGPQDDRKANCGGIEVSKNYKIIIDMYIALLSYKNGAFRLFHQNCFILRRIKYN